MLYIWLSFEPSDEGHEKCLSNIMYVFRHQLSDDFSAVATFFKEAVVSAGVVQRLVEKILREIMVVEDRLLVLYLEMVELLVVTCTEGRFTKLIKGLDLIVERLGCGGKGTEMVDGCLEKVLNSL